MTANLNVEEFTARVFDYIIIGGGTAGLALATRLSEDPTLSVGVIEAGAWDPKVNAINVPGLCGSILGNPKYDWAFMSMPQKHANNRQIFQPRGKALGGSSMVSTSARGIAAQASAREYDAIETLGNPGWNWEEFLRYMKKSETTLPLSSEVGKRYSIQQPHPRWHGDSGPIIKGYPTYFNSLHVPFLESLGILGLPTNPDSNRGHTVGATTVFAAVDSRAIRSYSANAYFEPNAHRKNLAVITCCTVSRITFGSSSDSVPLVATGVEFINGEKTYRVAANKEVVLCAGAFQSPQILELSGIGNRELLNKHGITSLVDLPADHVYVHTIHEIDPAFETVDFAQNPEEIAKQQELYKVQQGYLSSALAVLFGFLPSRLFSTEEQLNDWKQKATVLIADAPVGLKKQLELQIQWFLDAESAEAEILPFPGFFVPSGLKPTPGSRYSSMVSTLLHPLSRGSVHIASAEPTAPPAIDPNYFSNPLDLQVLLNILKFTLKLYKTGPLGAAVRQQVAPNAEECSSDEALIEYIKNNCGCVYHPVGTAAMLPKEDGGVVDPSLKVYGTANVRVVSSLDHVSSEC
ncbi:GMC oxidoreductase [Trametes maxima]|nr:GMC oxidoreductase [Trametes maxima]